MAVTCHQTGGPLPPSRSTGPVRCNSWSVRVRPCGRTARRCTDRWRASHRSCGFLQMVPRSCSGRRALRMHCHVLPVPSADGKGPAPRQLFNGKLDANVGAQWYADSRHIVFASHGSLWLGDSETEALTRLTTSATPAHWPDVGHDGTIAFAEDILDHDVIELPLAGGAPRVLVSSTLYDGAAAWAPTTGTFAYVANRGAGDEIRLRSIVDGSEQRLLSLRDFPDAPGDTTQVVRGLTYSPDGQWLAAAVMSLHPSVQAGIWIVPANGGTPRRTTSKDANALQASWSPDGKSMAIQMWETGCRSSASAAAKPEEWRRQRPLCSGISSGRQRANGSPPAGGGLARHRRRSSSIQPPERCVS